MPAKFANQTVDERSDKYAGLTETTDGFKFLLPMQTGGNMNKSEQFRAFTTNLDVAVVLSAYSTAKRLKELNLK